MKNLVLIVILVFTASACKGPKKEDTASMAENVQPENAVVEQDEGTDEIPNPSDISFEKAFEAYNTGDFKKSAAMLNTGITQLQQEEKSAVPADGLLFEKYVGELQQLADKIENNKITDTEELAQTVANVEMLIAHDYLTYSSTVVESKPESGNTYFEKAVSALDKAIPKLKGDALKEAQNIKAESMNLKADVQRGTAGVKEDLKKETNKIEDFLNRYHTALMD